MLMLKMLVLKMLKKEKKPTKQTMHSNYSLSMQLESFWQGWHKTSNKLYFHCGASSRTSSKSKKEKGKIKKIKGMWLEPSFVME